MKTTQADVLFYMVHSMPKWASDVINERKKIGYGALVSTGLPFAVSIHSCINERSGVKMLNKKNNVNSLANTISLLKIARSNMEQSRKYSAPDVSGMDGSKTMSEYLDHLSTNGGGSCASADRRIWSARFLRKIKKSS
jgi:hypothetical protein